jgi:hypothetical protein
MSLVHLYSSLQGHNRGRHMASRNASQQVQFESMLLKTNTMWRDEYPFWAI